MHKKIIYIYIYKRKNKIYLKQWKKVTEHTKRQLREKKENDTYERSMMKKTNINNWMKETMYLRRRQSAKEEASAHWQTSANIFIVKDIFWKRTKHFEYYSKIYLFMHRLSIAIIDKRRKEWLK